MTAAAPLERVQLSSRAVRDLRKLDARARRQVQEALEELTTDARNLDIRPLAGRSPWLRLRTGNFRVLYRILTPEENPGRNGMGWLVARVVDRRELERAIRSL